MDFASVLPAVLLEVAPHHVVLDMCAAPGGKTLVLSQMLLDPHGFHSTANSLATLHLNRQRSQQQIAEGESSGYEEGDQEQQLEDGADGHGVHVGEPCYQGKQQQQQEESLQQQQQQQQQQEESLQSQQQQQQAQEQKESASHASPTSQQSQQECLQEEASTQHTPADAEEVSPGTPSSTGSHPLQYRQQQKQPQRSCTSSGRLVANELDPARRSRLQDVINQYIPAHHRRRVRVTSHDGTRHWSRFEGEMYDRILLDAPCSSDRHVVAAAVAQGGRVSAGDWSVARCQQLAKLQTQVRLLQDMMVVKYGGMV